MPRAAPAPYIHRVSVHRAATATEVSVGCVLRVEAGVYHHWCRRGRLRVTLGGAMLARMARDPQAGPGPGDWCVVRAWPDGPHTLEQVLSVRRAG